MKKQGLDTSEENSEDYAFSVFFEYLSHMNKSGKPVKSYYLELIKSEIEFYKESGLLKLLNEINEDKRKQNEKTKP